MVSKGRTAELSSNNELSSTVSTDEIDSKLLFGVREYKKGNSLM